MSSSTFTPMTLAVDAPRDRGAKIYMIADTTVTMAAMATLGYFNKYDLRSFRPGDRVLGIASDGLTIMLGADRDASSQVPMTVEHQLAGVTAAAIVAALSADATSLQALAAAIVAALSADATSLQALAAAFAGDATAMTTLTNAVWTGIVGTKIVWDGTKLDVDYNDNGSATT